MSDDLFDVENISKKPKKIKVSSAEIIVHGVKEKPYFEIKYFDLFDNKLHIGFGSYKLDIVFEYLRDFFEISNIQNRVMEQNNKKFENDLISRKAAVELVIAEYDRFQAAGGSYSGRYELDKAIKMLQNMPTAFDKEKVIEELKEEGCIIDDGAGNRAVEIIEKGGIE